MNRTSIWIYLLLFSFVLAPLRAQEHVAASDSLSQKAIQLEHYDFCPSRYILPASLIGVGVAGLAIDGMHDYHLFSRRDSVKQIHVDNYLEWGMLGWVFACDLVGKEKHSVVDQFFVTAIAEGLNAGMTHFLKNQINETRPDGSPYSFPSGHTANVFLGAHIAFKEFKDTNMFLACSGYAVGLFVAGSRLYNNRHWACDVVAGAGFGILSAELAYQIYFPIKDAIARHANPSLADRLYLAPMVGNVNGVQFALRF
jgi:hypothetical protein